jgi:hypothetical protein
MRATVARCLRQEFFRREPDCANDPLIQRPSGFFAKHPAGKGEAQVGGIALRPGPLVDAHQRIDGHMVRRFFQGFAHTGVDQRLAGFKVPGGLVQAHTVHGVFLHKQKPPGPLHERGHRHVRFPDHSRLRKSRILAVAPDERPRKNEGRARPHALKFRLSYSMSMADRDGFIWYDGKLVPWREATTHVLTHSLHYGLSVFEGVRAYNTVSGTAIFRLAEHTQRLINSGKIYMMNIPYTKEVN